MHSAVMFFTGSYLCASMYEQLKCIVSSVFKTSLSQESEVKDAVLSHAVLLGIFI